jgi:plasmid stabilization system protein ParE
LHAGSHAFRAIARHIPQFATLGEIRDYYACIDENIEQRFLSQFDAVIERIVTFPRGAPPVEGFPGMRRARLRPFPYGVFYRLSGEDIVILRALHTRRDRSVLD